MRGTVWVKDSDTIDEGERRGCESGRDKEASVVLRKEVGEAGSRFGLRSE